MPVDEIVGGESSERDFGCDSLQHQSMRTSTGLQRTAKTRRTVDAQNKHSVG